MTKTLMSLRPEDAISGKTRRQVRRDMVYWTNLAEEYQRVYESSEGESTYSLAIDRLVHGDVLMTEDYGVRVACREDLGDTRVRAAAYWPDQNRGCLCRSMKTRGACSHDLAARLLRFEEAHRPVTRNPRCTERPL